MARPTKLTKATIELVCEAIELGATYELAAKYAGISYQTFNEWHKSKPVFSEALERAEGRAALKWLSKIEQQAQDDWRAAAWKLERRYPQQYGKVTHEHVGGGDGSAPIALGIHYFDASAALARLTGGSEGDR